MNRARKIPLSFYVILINYRHRIAHVRIPTKSHPHNVIGIDVTNIRSHQKNPVQVVGLQLVLPTIRNRTKYIYSIASISLSGGKYIA